MIFYYFEACGYVSEPFEAAGLDAAIDHVERSVRSAANLG